MSVVASADLDLFCSPKLAKAETAYFNNCGKYMRFWSGVNISSNG